MRMAVAGRRSRFSGPIELLEDALFEVHERVTISERVDRSVEMPAQPVAEALFRSRGRAALAQPS